MSFPQPEYLQFTASTTADNIAQALGVQKISSNAVGMGNGLTIAFSNLGQSSSTTVSINNSETIFDIEKGHSLAYYKRENCIFFYNANSSDNINKFGFFIKGKYTWKEEEDWVIGGTGTSYRDVRIYYKTSGGSVGWAYTPHYTNRTASNNPVKILTTVPFFISDPNFICNNQAFFVQLLPYDLNSQSKTYKIFMGNKSYLLRTNYSSSGIGSSNAPIMFDVTPEETDND